MASEGINCITKYAIMIISGMLIGASFYYLYINVTDEREYEAEKIIDIVILGATLALSVLAFWGALVENACLCYIALIAVVAVFCAFVWQLVRCFIKGENRRECDGQEYAVLAIILVSLTVLICAIWTFIQSIK